MNGAYTLANSTPIKPVDLAINILGMAVIGSIEQYCLENPVTCLVDGSHAACRQRPTGGRPARACSDLGNAAGAYKSRVLQGIWAAAPYLHNGSVPTLAQLLTPAGAAGEVVRGRPELRPGQYRPRGHPDPVQLCLPGHRLRQPELGQQQLRPRIWHHAVGREQAGAAGVSEDAVRGRRRCGRCSSPRIVPSGGRSLIAGLVSSRGQPLPCSHPGVTVLFAVDHSRRTIGSNGHGPSDVHNGLAG